VCWQPSWHRPRSFILVVRRPGTEHQHGARPAHSHRHRRLRSRLPTQLAPRPPGWSGHGHDHERGRFALVPAHRPHTAASTSPRRPSHHVPTVAGLRTHRHDCSTHFHYCRRARAIGFQHLPRTAVREKRRRPNTKSVQAGGRAGHPPTTRAARARQYVVDRRRRGGIRPSLRCDPSTASASARAAASVPTRPPLTFSRPPRRARDHRAAHRTPQGAGDHRGGRCAAGPARQPGPLLGLGHRPQRTHRGHRIRDRSISWARNIHSRFSDKFRVGINRSPPRRRSIELSRKSRTRTVKPRRARRQPRPGRTSAGDGNTGPHLRVTTPPAIMATEQSRLTLR